MLFDHKEFVEFVKSETGCGHEQACVILGRVITLTLNIDQSGYQRGYNDGYDEARLLD